MIERVRALPRIFGVRMHQHELLVLAAAVAYAAILSIFPLAITVIAVLSRFVEQVRAQQAVVDALAPYLPPQALPPLRDTLAAVVATRGTAGLVGVVGLLWAAPFVAGTLGHALNRVLHAPRARGYLRRKLTELILVLLGGAFLGLSVLASGAAEVVGRWPPAAAAATVFRTSPLAAAFSALSPWVFSAAAFFVTYRFLPNVHVSRRALMAGTVVAVVLFEGAKAVFLWYLTSLATYPLVYGPLAGLLVFLVWVYLVGLLVLLGAEVMGLVDRQQEANHA